MPVAQLGGSSRHAQWRARAWQQAPKPSQLARAGHLHRTGGAAHRPPTPAGSAAAAGPRGRPAGPAAAAPPPDQAGLLRPRAACSTPALRGPRCAERLQRAPCRLRCHEAASFNQTHVRLSWCEAGLALQVYLRAPHCAPQLASNPCSMTPTTSSPPAVLQTAFRYAACGPLPTLHSVSYSSAAKRRCCNRPGSESADAQCDKCWQRDTRRAHSGGGAEGAFALDVSAR
jgi:hypothetical protein